MANSIGSASRNRTGTSTTRATNSNTVKSSARKAPSSPTGVVDRLAPSTERLLAQGGMDSIAADTSNKIFEMNNPRVAARRQVQGGMDNIGADTTRKLQDLNEKTPNERRAEHFGPKLKETLDALLNL